MIIMTINPPSSSKRIYWGQMRIEKEYAAKLWQSCAAAPPASRLVPEAPGDILNEIEVLGGGGVGAGARERGNCISLAAG